MPFARAGLTQHASLIVYLDGAPTQHIHLPVIGEKRNLPAEPVWQAHIVSVHPCDQVSRRLPEGQIQAAFKPEVLTVAAKTNAWIRLGKRLHDVKCTIG